jgi:hypothetical protein
MGLAYQQQQQQRRQQQVVHTEPQRSVTPARSATEPPELDERFASASNSERASMAGLDGEGEGQAAAPPPGSMDACREAAAAEGPPLGAADLGVVLQQTEDFVLALGEQAVSRMARFEDASNRWYHLGGGQDRHAREKPLYERDVRLYQALGLRARADGAVVESVRRLVDEALLEAGATRALLLGRGLAGCDQAGGLMLDPEDMERDLALMEQAFATTGFSSGEASLLAGIEQAPAELMAQLEVQSHGMSASIAQLRAQAVALEAAGVEERKAEIEKVITVCDKLGEVMRLCAAGYRLGEGTTHGERDEVKESVLELVENPHKVVGFVARVAYEDELHMLAGELSALTTSEDAWGELARAEAIRKDLGEYTLAVHAIDEHQQDARDQRDDYVARLGTLGRTMDLAAAVRGRALDGDVGEAMENLARIHATHRSLVGVEGPLQAAMDRSLATGRLIGAASRARPEQAWLITLRQQLSGPAELYRSVHQGLEASSREVAARRGELETISDRFGDIIQRQRR